MPQCGFNVALASDNEESDGEELYGLVLGSRSLITLLSSAFFASIVFFFLTDCWYIPRSSTSCFAFWELIEPRALECHIRRDFAFYQDEIHRFSSCFFGLALFCFLSKDFSPFSSVSLRRNELVSKVIEFKQKILSSWNRVFPAKSRWGVNDLLVLRHLGDLLTFIKNSLFANRARFYISLTFFGGNDELDRNRPM